MEVSIRSRRSRQLKSSIRINRAFASLIPESQFTTLILGTRHLNDNDPQMKSVLRLNQVTLQTRSVLCLNH